MKKNKTIFLADNVKIVYNDREEMDGDPKGWFLVISNEAMMRPIIKAVAKKRFHNVAIPMQVIYLGKQLYALRSYKKV